MHIQKFEFAVRCFFAKLLSPLDTLAITMQGPDSTLHTVVSLSKAAYDYLEELRANLDKVFQSGTKFAEDNDMESELLDRIGFANFLADWTKEIIKSPCLSLMNSSEN